MQVALWGYAKALQCFRLDVNTSKHVYNGNVNNRSEDDCKYLYVFQVVPPSGVLLSVECVHACEGETNSDQSSDNWL